MLAARWHGHVHRARSCGRARCWSCSKAATRSAARNGSATCCVACEADYRGRGGPRQRPYPQADLLRAARRSARSSSRLRQKNAKDSPARQIGERLRLRRLEALRPVGYQAKT